MSKKSTRWPMWKLVLAMVLCAAVSAVLFVLAGLVEVDMDPDTRFDPGTQSIVNMATLLLMLGTAVGLLGVLYAIWIGYRIYDARIPAWEKKTRHRRRKKR